MAVAHSQRADGLDRLSGFQPIFVKTFCELFPMALIQCSRGRHVAMFAELPAITGLLGEIWHD